MGTQKLKRLIKQLEDGAKGFDVELERIAKRQESNILKLNKEQLFKGQDSEGKSLGKYRSKAYALFKRMLNPLGVVDLFLTGKFYRGFFVKSAKLPITIDSKDSKRDELVDKYGEKLFGLTPESKKIFVGQFVKASVIKYYKKLLHVR